MNINTRVAENHVMDKYKNLLEDKVMKPSLRLTNA
jgi:hypothetical protein